MEKKMRLYLSTAIIAIGLGTGAIAAPVQYELDPEHTTVFFTVDHIGYAGTLGVFGSVEGTFTYDMDTQDLSDVQVSIDAKSVNTFNKARDGHVKKADFLNVRKHPKITFVASGGKAASKTSGTVTGDLTILGNTRPVTLNVKLNKAAPYPFGHKRFVLGLSMDTAIDRSDFGMSYGVANGLVGDTVYITIEAEAMQMK
ncbi:YceI family protein [uncultured Roseobacter sp.]|uniref:YceI family protein n=2 Tax=uncultured Roseobacter sp. TaxID=114847 RepID=UPI002622E2EF|nr:YceI family protein [uncultured Roseobacter sp.]